MKRFTSYLSETTLTKEWSRFKLNISTHKYKLIFLGGCCTFPLYKPYIIDFTNEYVSNSSKEIERKLEIDQPLNNVT